MVRVITQETFNDVVKENIEEFDMSPEQAVEEAVLQFEAQGVDLSNIIKNVEITQGTHPLKGALDRLREALDSKTEELFKLSVKTVQQECDKDVASKILAGKEGGYSLLLDCFDTFKDRESQILTLKALLSLLSGYPDLFDSKGSKLLMRFLTPDCDTELTRYSLRVLRECCILHETNRQIIHSDLCESGLEHIFRQGALKEACCLVRALCLDDDIRIQVSRAHEHARTMAIELLPPLTNLLKDSSISEEEVTEVVLTMSSLVVRNELCAKVNECGGLQNIREILFKHQDIERTARVSLILLKTLAGNDDVKAEIMADGSLVRTALFCIDHHSSSAALCGAGLGFISILALRSPVNSRILVSMNVPELIVSCMKQHPKDRPVQQRGAWAVRNIVSRSRDLCEEFLKLGIEELLVTAAQKHSECGDDVKAALRDLGCNVRLIEQWTGKGVSMQS